MSRFRHARERQDTEALEALTDYWVDEFLDELGRQTRITEQEISDVLRGQGLTADAVNKALGTNTKEAGAMNLVRALGGFILKSVWHMIVRPFLAIGKLIVSSSFRTEIKTAFKRALNHEVRASKHMLSVAGRLARGEVVNKQERKSAMRQLVGILTKSVFLYFAGPNVATLFKSGVWKAISALLAPLDEILLVFLDKPIRAASQKLMSADLGLGLPAGF